VAAPWIATVISRQGSTFGPVDRRTLVRGVSELYASKRRDPSKSECTARKTSSLGLGRAGRQWSAKMWRSWFFPAYSPAQSKGISDEVIVCRFKYRMPNEEYPGKATRPTKIGRTGSRDVKRIDRGDGPEYVELHSRSAHLSPRARGEYLVNAGDVRRAQVFERGRREQTAFSVNEIRAESVRMLTRPRLPQGTISGVFRQPRRATAKPADAIAGLRCWLPHTRAQVEAKWHATDAVWQEQDEPRVELEHPTTLSR